MSKLSGSGEIGETSATGATGETSGCRFRIRRRRHDHHVNDLATAYALEALEPAERARVDRHRRSCPSCDQYVTRECRVVGLLHLVAPPVTPPPDVKVALFARVAHAQRAITAQPPLSAPLTARPSRTPTIPASRAAMAATPVLRGSISRPLVSRQGWATRWAAALLVLPLLLALAATGTWAMQLRAEADQHDDRTNSFSVALEQALTGDGTVYDLLPGPAAPSAKGWIVADDTRRTATFFMKNPTAESGQRYQLLVNHEGQQQVLTEVTLDGRGRGLIAFSPDRPLVDYRLVRVKAPPPPSNDSETSNSGMALWGQIEAPTDPPGNDPSIG